MDFDSIGLRLSNAHSHYFQTRATDVSLSSANATNYLTTRTDDVRHSIKSPFRARGERISCFNLHYAEHRVCKKKKSLINFQIFSSFICDVKFRISDGTHLHGVNKVSSESDTCVVLTWNETKKKFHQ